MLFGCRPNTMITTANFTSCHPHPTTRREGLPDTPRAQPLEKRNGLREAGTKRNLFSRRPTFSRWTLKKIIREGWQACTDHIWSAFRKLRLLGMPTWCISSAHQSYKAPLVGPSMPPQPEEGCQMEIWSSAFLLGGGTDSLHCTTQ